STLTIYGITAKGEHIVNSQKLEVDKGIFGFFYRKTTANKMRNCINLIFIHDGGTDSYRPGSFTDAYFFEQIIRKLFIYIFFPMISYIDKRWVEFHKWVNPFKNIINSFAFQGGQNFE